MVESIFITYTSGDYGINYRTLRSREPPRWLEKLKSEARHDDVVIGNPTEGHPLSATCHRLLIISSRFLVDY